MVMHSYHHNATFLQLVVIQLQIMRLSLLKSQDRVSLIKLKAPPPVGPIKDRKPIKGTVNTLAEALGERP